MCESDENAPLFAPRADVVGTTGTGLDAWVATIVADPGLNHALSLDDIAGGARAADALNHLILDGIRATGVANDGTLNAADLFDVNRWIQADPDRHAAFVDLHGDDDWTETGEREWGFHLVQNDGATTRAFDENAVNTVFDGTYHIGFDIACGRFLNEDGNQNQDLEDVAYWLSDALKADLAAGTLANAGVNPYPVATTGTALDAVVALIAADPGLNRSIGTFEITEGATAADSLNAMILESITTRGLANDGVITASDVYDINAWVRADPDRLARFVDLHGDDDWTETGEREWGFHRVQNDGAETRLFGNNNAVNTVLDGLYHIGFEIDCGRFRNEDGDANASVEDVAHWLDQLLRPTLEAGDLVRTDVDPYAAVTWTGTGLDLLVSTILADEGLNLAIPTADIAAGAAAASQLNVLLLEAIHATGAANDGALSTLDLRAINAWVQADDARHARFIDLHGDDAWSETGEDLEWGFHLVQNDGDTAYLFDRPAVDTVADGLYHFGFDIAHGAFVNEDGNTNLSLTTATRWLNTLLQTDLATGTLVNAAFIPEPETLDALYGEAVLSRRTDSFDGSGTFVNLGHTPALELANGTIAFAFTLNDAGPWQTLFSKDASGTTHPGHLTAWVEDGGITVRFQDIGQDIHLETEGLTIEAGVEYDVALTFGDGGAALYVDGTLADSDPDFRVNLSANPETLVLGAGTTGRTPGQLNNLRDFLNGEIEGFSVFDRALSPLEIQYLENAPADYVLPNSAPVAGADGPVYVVAGRSVVLPFAMLLANDTDKNGDALGIGAIVSTTGGTVTRANVDGVDSLVFTADANAAGDGAFAYRVRDGFGGADTATVTLTILAPDQFAADLVLQQGPMAFAGTGADVVNVSHVDALAQLEGTYAFTFDAEDGAGGALFSKDARGYLSGGHLTAWAEADGAVSVRYQSTDQSVYLEAGSDLADPDGPTHVAFTFDDAAAVLFVNGVEADRVDLAGSFAAGMAGNTESLVIGASATTRDSGLLNNLNDFFSGTIGDFLVFDRALDGDEVQMLQALAAGDGGGADDPRVVHAIAGTIEVDNRSRQAVEIDHTDALALDEGTVAFRFTADRLDRVDVLMAKDAAGVGEGETTISVESDGDLQVLFQQPGGTVRLTAAGAIAAGESHHVAFTFGDGAARLYLDGIEVAAADGCNTDWRDNGEDLVIGAGTHLRSDSDPDWRGRPFDGRIDDFVLFNAALDAADIFDLAAGGSNALFV